MKQEKEQWIIFFDIDDARYYFEKVYDNIDRVKFSKERFCVFESILDVDIVIDRIQSILKVSNPVGNIQLKGNKIKLKAAKVTIE